eukprot:CAMPEP_0174255108 /NCGR_PEP_ID=MMETSP0439-20130205/4443_1 /TAXON_ID=0 /ORGANISM="Stereomyxa ramosa, Strain Chinc5" /LENGTH=97 /DNA_ID=CAMNT_0015337131 /DNA_START=157 /DNA_END=450 /DNA_ORIENTATION=-
MVNYSKRVQPHLGTKGVERSGAWLKASEYIWEPAVVQKLMNEFPQRFQAQTGGYARIWRIHKRKRDKTQMCVIGFCDVLPSRKGLEKQWRDDSCFSI